MTLEKKLRRLKQKAEGARLISEKLIDISHYLFESAKEAGGLRKKWYKVQAVIIQTIGIEYSNSKCINKYYNLRKRIKENREILDRIPI